MARKDAILNMKQVLITRRDALRKALAGDLSLLKELREQSAGDVIDAAARFGPRRDQFSTGRSGKPRTCPDRKRPGADAWRNVWLV
ncbi:MAG: hypothetical protein R3C10_01010 [Pirellulales bacterium]